MSILKMITSLFDFGGYKTLSNPRTHFDLNNKITPKIDLEKFEDLEDLELGKNINKTMLEIHDTEKYVKCKFTPILQNPDLELGFGPIVEINNEDVIVDMNAFEKCKVYENYISFMESISYLVCPLKVPVIFKDIYPSWNTKTIDNHVVMHIESSSMGLRLK